MTELYSKFFKPALPTEFAERLEPYVEILDAGTPWFVALIIIGAVLYTYYEVDRQVTRNPEIPKKLRQLYVTGEQFTKYDLQDESEFAEWKERAITWHRETLDWINENMSQAAASRFSDAPASTMGGMRVENSAAVNDEHDRLVHAVKRERDHLKDLIENEAWDEKETKKEKQWRLASIFRSKKPAD